METQLLDRIVRGLQARDIAAFPVVHAGVDDDIAAVLVRMNTGDYSHMPLRDANGTVVRVLRRDVAQGKSGRAHDAATALDIDGHVVDASDPLSSVVAKLPSAGFLLVSSRESGYPDRIAGIINHSDVVSLPVRLLIYMCTMQLERRVIDVIADTGRDTGNPQLSELWRRAEAKQKKAGERRSSVESYLSFRDLMAIGQARQLLRLEDAAELELLCAARNFACHAAIGSPAGEPTPSEIPGVVERCVNLVGRLLG